MCSEYVVCSLVVENFSAFAKFLVVVALFKVCHSLCRRFGIARPSREDGEGEMATACREHEKAVRNLKARVSS